MIDQYTSIEDIFVRQEELNKQKRMFQQQIRLGTAGDKDRIAKQWLQLSVWYAEIDSKANTAYCLGQYKHFTGDILEIEHEVPATVEIPEPEVPYHPWQSRADIGDD